MRNKIIIANWKMNPLTGKGAAGLFSGVVKNLRNVKKTEVVICPPFLFLERFRDACQRTKKIALGAQDAFGGETGAFTGEVSSDMLYESGVKYVLLGHSERRELGENNKTINKKIKGSIASNLRVVLCVGEKERDENHGYFNVVKVQLEECLAGIPKNLVHKILIAYEPVWAISTTFRHKDATAYDSREMSIFVRRVLSDKYGKNANKIKILYGGSVSPKSAEEFLSDGGVDGLLIGKASLDPKKFAEVINIAENL